MQTLERLPGCRTNFVRMISPVLVATLAFPAFADADTVKDIQAGKERAMKVCSPCHVIPVPPNPRASFSAFGATFRRDSERIKGDA